MTTATSPPAGEFESKLLPLGKLIDCPLNTRQINPDDPALRDLGESLAHRQEVDLIVRPVITGEYEVLDGKRRLAAARLRDDVPQLWCQVREPCSDAAALKVIIVTQLHRKDLDPLAEAALVRQLLDGGMTQEAAGAELGRPAAWVAKRAKLTDLAATWLDGLAAGKFAWATVAYLEHIARLPETVQIEIAGDYAEAWRKPASVAEFANEIRERYLHTLKQAPWKLDDLGVLAKAGACTACSKRSSCQLTLFADGEPSAADRCLDAVCWSEKLSAHTAAKVRTLAEKHAKVLVLTDNSGDDHAQPAPAKLPEQAVVIRRNIGLEDCRKSDEGAIPALDAETGKLSWVKVAAWAPAETRQALGLEPVSAKGKREKAKGDASAPTAAQRREAKRLKMRMNIIDEEIIDADPPGAEEVMALYVTFMLGNFDPLSSNGWAEFKANMKKSKDELGAELFADFTKRLHGLRGQVRPTMPPDEAAIAALERLATLDPAEQRAKVLAEIPEPKRKG